MIKLSDTQRVLLAAACQHPDGSVLPLPACIRPGGGAAKAISALLRRGLAEERETSDQAAIRRTEAEVRLGVFITEAGLAAIGAEDSQQDIPAASALHAGTVASAKSKSKTSAMIELLARPCGVPVPELIELTGWLPHTLRAAMTGLRRKGHQVERSKRNGVTCYRITGAA